MPKQERISQSDLPRTSLEKALRLPQALMDQFAGEATAPVDLALAVGVKPSSSGWRALTGAAIGYGLTEGGYNASAIGLTSLGRRVVAPQEEGEDIEALREACLKPRVVGGFLGKYEGSKFPRADIAQNVLRSQFDVPAARTAEALGMIVKNAETIGAFRVIGGDRYVGLAPLAPQLRTSGTVTEKPAQESQRITPEVAQSLTTAARAAGPQRERVVNTVFVSHGGSTKIVEQVKQLLELADLEAEIAVEREIAAIPVPDNIFDAMSRSDAAIICVTADEGRESAKGYEVDANVLIEIGAAYVRHDKRLVLLWDRRVTVPPILQDLYRCEFKGDALSWTAGIRLQKALIAIKKGNAPR
ncbi:MAG: hypothetical protein F4174_03115 [Acidobacteria bacterium]|nr:hypothetical protein [Acidobacteriota bacterium]